MRGMGYRFLMIGFVPRPSADTNFYNFREMQAAHRFNRITIRQNTILLDSLDKECKAQRQELKQIQISRTIRLFYYSFSLSPPITFQIHTIEWVITRSVRIFKYPFLRLSLQNFSFTTKVIIFKASIFTGLIFKNNLAFF